MHAVARHLQRFAFVAAALAIAGACAEGAAWLANERWATPLDADGRVDFPALSRRNATRAGEARDERPLGEVIRSSAGPGEAIPLLSVAYYLDPERGSKIAIDGRPVLPLSLQPDAAGYYCNEHGRYAPFRLDGHGFRNPPQAWAAPRHPLLVVGDSMAMGACLQESESFVGRLRESFPGTLNLAVGANGPLMEYATLVEYLPATRPELTLWAYFENDLSDYSRDAANPLLRSYLEKPGFHQDLARLWPRLVPEIRALTSSYLEAVLAAEAAQRTLPPARWTPKSLHLVRRARFLSAPAEPPPPAANGAAMATLLRKARDLAAGHGSRFAIVYIPDCRPAGRKHDDLVLENVRGAGVPIIDTRPALAELGARGVPTHSFCPGGHLSKQGSEAIAELVRVESRRLLAGPAPR